MNIQMKHLLCECVQDYGCTCLCVFALGGQACTRVTIFLEQLLAYYLQLHLFLLFHQESKSINKEEQKKVADGSEEASDKKTPFHSYRICAICDKHDT